MERCVESSEQLEEVFHPDCKGLEILADGHGEVQLAGL